MSNQPVTRADIEEVTSKLESLEDKLKGEKWQTLTIGILIAIVTAVSTTISTCVTTRKQEEVKTDLVGLTTRQQEEVKTELATRFQQHSEMGKQIAGKQMEFFNQATGLLKDMDDSFNEVCYLSPSKQAEDKLAAALDKYRQLLSQATAEIADEKIKAQLKLYSGFILEKLSAIKSGATDQQKSSFYKDSWKILKGAEEQLNKVLNSR
jgi:hypothetical protein